MIKSQAETPRSYIVLTEQGEKGPKVKLVPKANIQSSGMNSTAKSAQKESAHNQSASSVPKLVVRKNQGLVQEESKGVPTAPLGIGNIKSHPKSLSYQTTPCP